MSVPQSKDDLLGIHLNRLEEDCQGQPQLMSVWGQKLAESRKALATHKKNIKVAKARLAQDVRQNPERFGLVKITEGAIEELQTLDPSIDTMEDRLIQLVFEEDVLDQFVKAIVDRKEELSNLTKLHGQMYWSKPDVGPDKQTKAAREETMRRAGQAVEEPSEDDPKRTKKLPRRTTMRD